MQMKVREALELLDAATAAAWVEEKKENRVRKLL